MSCADKPHALPPGALATFSQRDASLLGKRGIDVRGLQALDGSGCAAKTPDGIAKSFVDGTCVDLGEPYAAQAAADGSHGHTPLRFLPDFQQNPDGSLRQHGARLHAAVTALQFPPRCRRNRVFYMHELPQVGFGSVIEYAVMFLGRSLSLGTQFRIGSNSSMAWTSEWFCGPQRSLACYFDLTSCCAAVLAGDGHARRPLILPRRRDPINVAADGFNEYGSAWVAAQLTAFLFERVTPRTRAELLRRKSTLPPWQHSDSDGSSSWSTLSELAGSGRILTIGMHIRAGDACHKGRYCPHNLTASYFSAAAELRRVYGANRILLATDHAPAAALCRTGVLGFDCVTQRLERGKFDAAELIENRVAQHASGGLSGSAVALDALADIDLLAGCDMFVLLLRSCFARVAYALAMGRKGSPPPVISLEAPWSPALKLKKKMKMRHRINNGGNFAMRKSRTKPPRT